MKLHQFSIRSLLLVFTVLAVAFAWIHAERTKSHRQQAAMAALSERNVLFIRPWEPATRQGLLRMILGDNSGDFIFDATFLGGKDDDLRFLAALPKVSDVDLLDGEYSSGGVAYLRSVSSLRCVTLRTRMSMEVFEELRQLPQLESIRLDHSMLMGASFEDPKVKRVATFEEY